MEREREREVREKKKATIEERMSFHEFKECCSIDHSTDQEEQLTDPDISKEDMAGMTRKDTTIQPQQQIME